MVTHDVSSAIQYLKGEALKVREDHWGNTMNDMDRHATLSETGDI